MRVLGSATAAAFDEPAARRPREGPFQAEAAAIDASPLLDDATCAAIARGNALAVFPRFAGTPQPLTEPAGVPEASPRALVGSAG